MRLRRTVRYVCWKSFIGTCVLMSLVGCVTEAALKRQSEAEGQFKLGLSYVHTDLQNAIVLFERAIDIDPNHHDAHLELGIVYGSRGRLDAAEEHYKQAIRIDSDSSEAHNNLGTVYARQAQWDRAVEEYQKALENPMYPWPDTAYYNLARSLSKIGEHDEALIALRNARSIVPLSIPAMLIHKEFGRIYEKIGKIEWARASYQEAIEAIEADDQGTYRDQLEEYLRNLETTSDGEKHHQP
ncbi:MAG TPA: tetratricopeptide repeat protein [Nitrospirales bacterium]|nr:tetratricopeptide repeat protein [Nitrospirales bacterium]